MANAAKDHWEQIYSTKKPEEVSWTQAVPNASLDSITRLHLSKSAQIIDIGGGEGKLVDHLLGEGYGNITVLDISEHAINHAKTRLGNDAKRVRWIVQDVRDYRPSEKFDLIHDRALFHFLCGNDEIAGYIAMVENGISPGGYLVVATFSTEGPPKCSGLEVTRYDEESISALFANGFNKIRSFTETHITPFHTHQQFLFSTFQRKRHR